MARPVILKSRGKVTSVNRNDLTVILFDIKGEEVYGEVSKSIFPVAGYRVGQIFDYECYTSATKTSVKYSLVPAREPTKVEVRQMERVVRRDLSSLDLDRT
jgi:hypothetical protein